MLDCTVFYECWQMQCCGIPFSVGDAVKWLVISAGLVEDPAPACKVDYYYEAHHPDWRDLFMLEGPVASIRVSYCRSEPRAEDPRVLEPVPVSLVAAASVNGSEETQGDVTAEGYVVEVAGCTVRPAKEEEVTFR